MFYEGGIFEKELLLGACMEPSILLTVEAGKLVIYMFFWRS
jgi:hypothetical protein